MLTVLELASKAVECTQADPLGSCLTVSKVFRLLDTSGIRNQHLANPLNAPPQLGCIQPRTVPLEGNELVNGDFLALVHCEHDPFVRLDDYDDLPSLEAFLTSNSGIVNPFITYCVAFIRGTVRSYEIAYCEPNGAVGRFNKTAQETVGPQAAEGAEKRWVIWEDGD